jgi:iron-sulfur cluster repair protein YtfE (RIC family)
VTTLVSRVLQKEHERLLDQVAALTELATAPVLPGSAERTRGLAEAAASLREHLVQHIAIEERVLYPTFERVTRTPNVTASMIADHREIVQRLERICAATAVNDHDDAPPTDHSSVAAEVWGLAAIVGMHVDKEQELLFGELDRRLTPVDATALLRNLELDMPLTEQLDPAEASLYSHVRAHIANEQFAIDGYQQIATTYDRSTYVGYLVDLILEDEKRHHQLFADLLATIEQRAAEDRSTPVPEVRPLPELDELHSKLESYLQFEKQDRDELAQLSKALRSQPADSLWPLLIDIMRRDTDKHIHILQFLCRNASARPTHSSRWLARHRNR